MRNAHGERGAAAIELAVLVPVLLAFLLLVVFGGRVVQAENDVRSAAHEAARAASLRGDPQAAEASARQTAAQNLEEGGVGCRRLSVEVDTAELHPGGHVAVTVSCVASFSDVSLLLVPGERTFAATAIEVVDTHRGGG